MALNPTRTTMAHAICGFFFAVFLPIMNKRDKDDLKRNAKRAHIREYHEARQVACQECDLEYRPITAETDGGAYTQSWEIVQPNPLGKQVIEQGRYPAPWAKRANGTSLAELR